VIKWVLFRRDVVFISSRNRVKSGMCIRSNLFNSENGDIVGQQIVELTNQLFRVGYRGLQVEVRSHLFCMDACICTTSTSKGYGTSENGLHGLSKGRLNGDGVGLDLPTMIIRSVVCKVNEIAHKLLFL